MSTRDQNQQTTFCFDFPRSEKQYKPNNVIHFESHKSCSKNNNTDELKGAFDSLVKKAERLDW